MTTPHLECSREEHVTQGQRCEGPVPPCAVQGEFRGTNPHLNGNLGDMGAFPLPSSVRVKYGEVKAQLCHHTVGSSASGEKQDRAQTSTQSC